MRKYRQRLTREKSAEEEGFKMRANESSRCIIVRSPLMLIAWPYRGFTVIISIYSSDIGDSYISLTYIHTLQPRLTGREKGGRARDRVGRS